MYRNKGRPAKKKPIVALRKIYASRCLTEWETMLFFSRQPARFTLNGLQFTTLHHYREELDGSLYPNVFRIDNFVTEDEIKGVGVTFANNADKFSNSPLAAGSSDTQVRKSRTLMCPRQNSVMCRNLAERAAALVDLKSTHVETQLLTYVGNGTDPEYFNIHHDTGDVDDNHLGTEPDPDNGDEADVADYLSDDGVTRIFTLFVYFNTVRNEGETAFPWLNIVQAPIRGSAVMWPNVNPDGSVQKFTAHEARPVKTKNVQKFAMNVWLHSLNYTDPSTDVYRIDHREPKRGGFGKVGAEWWARYNA
jgi:hypothetical protein